MLMTLICLCLLNEVIDATIISGTWCCSPAGRCYYRSIQLCRFNDCVNGCSVNFGGSLAKVDSQAVHDFLYSKGFINETATAFFGLKWANPEHKWPDGSTLGLWKNWMGVPGTNTCTRYQGLFWIDTTCSGFLQPRFNYLCEVAGYSPTCESINGIHRTSPQPITSTEEPASTTAALHMETTTETSTIKLPVTTVFPLETTTEEMVSSTITLPATTALHLETTTEDVATVTSGSKVTTDGLEASSAGISTTFSPAITDSARQSITAVSFPMGTEEAIKSTALRNKGNGQDLPTLTNQYLTTNETRISANMVCNDGNNPFGDVIEESLPGGVPHGSSHRTDSNNSRRVLEHSLWSYWASCDVTCGGGTQTRVRLFYICRHDSVDESYKIIRSANGFEFGYSVERRECNIITCPVVWSAWFRTSACIGECGQGAIGRVRFSKKVVDYGQDPCLSECVKLSPQAVDDERIQSPFTEADMRTSAFIIGIIKLLFLVTFLIFVLIMDFLPSSHRRRRAS